MNETFKLPTLKFSYYALEPFIDGKTMEIHLTKHHATYVANLNKAIENYPDLQTKSIEEILLNIETVPSEIKQTVINHGGGHHNHTLFWELLTPNSEKMPKDELLQVLSETFGSFDNFKLEFNKAATGKFGSGWAWLVKDSDNTLSIITTQNQDSPLLQGLKPMLGLDVWEHAYYLSYQNKRADYVEAWWNIIDWETVSKKFSE